MMSIIPTRTTGFFLSCRDIRCVLISSHGDELAYVGVPEKNIIRFIKTCEVPTWILPLGEPFTKESWYTQRPILSDEFRRIFAMNYRLI